MATQVEVSAALSSLAGLSERASEAKLQHTFASSLSSASSRPSELPGSLTPLLLEERSAFGNPSRPASMTPAASRPRLTPKPFSRETSADTFAMVRPPVPTLKPGNFAPKPSAFAKTFDDVAAAKGLTGSVPPLVDQKSIESKSHSELIANMPFYSSPQPNTVILFETGSAEKTRLKLTPEQNVVGSSKTSSTLQAREGQPPSSRAEMSYRRSEGAAIHRQLSLSSESRPASCNPRRSLERKGTFTEERADETESRFSRVLCFASEVQPRPKQRPVSAIFLESLKDQKHGGPDVSDEQALPEKSWVRKPRPLSMDLTAKFESKDFSVQRKSGPAEDKERNLDAEVGCSSPSETVALGRADHPKSKLQAAVQTADSPGVKSNSSSPIETPALSQPASSCWNAPKSLGQASAKDRKYLWELRLRSQDEPDEREMAAVATPAKSKEPPPSKGMEERGAPSQEDTGTAGEPSANATDAESRRFRGGSVKKPVRLLGASASSTTPANAEPPPPGSPGKENRIMNIQQRIKELTAESADAKPGDVRRSFRSRPLSADLTKLFSGPVTGGEAKPERQAELKRKLGSEGPDIQENKTDLLHGVDSRESRAAGPPGKPRPLMRVPLTDRPLERDASFARERQGAALKDGGSASLADHDTKTHSAPPLENECLKTVRATMFEHHVQRHMVAADHFGSEAAFQLVAEHMGGLLAHRRELGVEQAPETRVVSKQVPSKQVEAPLDGVKYGSTKPLSVDKVPQAAAWGKRAPQESCEKPTQSHAEDSLMYQRIEPRYEILQTVGETAQSVAVAAVPEDKAVTLRSRRALKERRKTEGGLADALWPRSLDLKGAGWKEEGLVSKASEVGEAGARTAALKERSASCGQHVSHELDATQAGQQHLTARASYFANRHKDLGTTDANVSALPVEVGRESLPGRAEGPSMPKGFPGGWRAASGTCQSTAPASPGEHGSPSSACGVSQRPKLDNKAPPRQESKAFGLRKSPAAYSAQEASAVSGRRTEADRFPQPGAEEQAGRSGRHSLAPKALERWRRKTLPHEAVRFEEVGAPAQESTRALSRRDSWQLRDGSAAKTGLQVSRSGAEPAEGRSVSPGSPGDSRENPPSPLEPKATYFAVTYQIPGENESISGEAFEPLASRETPSLAQNTLLTPSSSAAGRPHPAHHQYSKRFSGTQGSLDRHLGKSWGLGETSNLAKKGTSRYPLAEVRGENWRSLERRPEDAKERGASADPLQADPKSPPYLRFLHQERARSGPAGASLGTAKERGADSYRSRVLDIDALMAEYEEDAKKASVVLEEREGGLPEHGTLFPWEKVACKRNSADRTSASYDWSDPRGSDRSAGCVGQGVHGMDFSGSKRESRELSPFKGDREAKFSPPHWGRPAAERPKYLPGDPVGPRKKTFITDEEEGESLALGHQGAKYANDVVVQVPKLARMEVEPEAAAAPRPSQALPDRASWKGVSSQQQASVFWGQDQHTASHARGTRKGGAHGSSSAADSSAAESRADRISSAPGLANAPPELRRSYSEKARQARGRGSFPLAPEAKERRDEPRARQSFPPESAGSQLHKRSAPQQDASFPKEKQDLDRTKQDQESLAAARNSPYLPIQRRSRSFYKERTADRWAADQLKQCCGRPAPKARDTDTLVPEADSQYGTWSDQRHSGDSFAPESPSSDSTVTSARKQPPSGRLSFSSQTDAASAADQRDSSSRGQRSSSLDRSSLDVDSADDSEVPAPASLDFAFLDQTPVLDSSALKTRVQLSKRRRQHRTPISHLLRRSTGGDAEQRLSVAEEGDSAWMFKDSTDKPAKREASEEEEKPHPVERSPVSQPQRLPVFPGMDHSALKAQLRKRQETEGSAVGSPALLSKSPKSSLQSRAVGGPEKEERSEEASPQWLKELRSKKRQSQYENQV